MKVNSLIKYQCWSTMKPLLIFYTIVYGIVALGYFISYITFGSFDKGVFNSIELACLIYLGITGSLGFSEDFKMAIQNGFTRKQIFIAVIVMFSFVALIMSVVDTIFAQILPAYTSLFQQIYGSGHSVIIQWLLLGLIYFSVAISAYLCTLLANKIGKKRFYFIVIALSLIILVIVPLVINIYIPLEIVTKIANAIVWAFGFTANGTIQFFNPIICIVLIIGIIEYFSFVTIKKTELK